MRQRFSIAYIQSTSTFIRIEEPYQFHLVFQGYGVSVICICVRNNADKSAHFESDPVADMYDFLPGSLILPDTG